MPSDNDYDKDGWYTPPKNFSEQRGCKCGCDEQALAKKAFAQREFVKWCAQNLQRKYDPSFNKASRVVLAAVSNSPQPKTLAAVVEAYNPEKNYAPVQKEEDF